MDELLDRYKKRIFDDPFFGQAMQFCWKHNEPFEHKVIVEVGCGSGEISVLFALHGAKVTGVDINSQVIENSNELAKKWSVEDTCCFITGSTEALPLASYTADLIFSRSTMQYLDRTAAIPECLRVLKPGGTLVLIENLPSNPFMRLYRSVRRLKAKSDQDVAYEKSLKGYLTQSEFDKLGVEFDSIFRKNYHFLRMFPMLLGLKANHLHGADAIIRKVDSFFSTVDFLLFDKLPFLKNNAWFTCFIAKGKK